MVIVLDAFFAVFFTESRLGMSETDTQPADNAALPFDDDEDGVPYVDPDAPVEDYPIEIEALRNTFGEQVIHEDL